MNKNIKVENFNRNDIEVSVVMPCLNEEQTVGICIDKCFEAFHKNNIKGEVVVADNGSIDKSKKIIIQKGARLVEEKRKGYGSAYLKGFSEARGKYIIMGDSDDTYDFLDLGRFVSSLREGSDFVIGSRLKGSISKGAGSMPWLHRYIGNPVLTFILKNLFDINVSDAHCGMRSFTKEAYEKLNLQTLGMEFASEMIINAKRASLKIKEIPIAYSLRRGESKLRTFKDGWRHLRFMLLYSPNFLFLFPGILFILIGFFLIFLLLGGPVEISGRHFDFHFMFIGSLLSIIGYQIINLGLFTKIYAFSEKFEKEVNNEFIKFLILKLTLERMLIIGFLLFLVGILTFGDILLIWMKSGFGNLFEIRKMILSVTLIILGVQTCFNGFFYSVLKLEKK